VVPRRPPLPAGPYLVVGLARSGQAVARVLADHGDVIGVDSARPDVDIPGEVHLESDGVDLLDRVNAVVKSPGVAGDAAVVVTALARGVEVLGELEVGWRLLSNPFVAVTGTNGKTTTVELLGAMWRTAGMPVVVAGNVGTPVSALVGAVDEQTTIVCECSSFQLEDTRAFAPDCAVLLNVQEDHLDRHGELADYACAKARIFANQGPRALALLPAELDHLHRGAGRRHHLEVEWTADGGMHHFPGGEIDSSEIRLRGAHNLENATAAAVAAAAMGVPHEAILETLRTFAGVPNRLEDVARIDGVLYVNDSKATNPASAVRGIEAFDSGVHAILGGSLKGGDFAVLREAVSKRCVAAYLIGAAQQRLAVDLDSTVTLRGCGTLERAFEAASEAATEGDVVLLSPACASFDAFRDFEHRGQRFRELVHGLE